MRNTKLTLLSLPGLLLLFMSANCQQPEARFFDNRATVEQWIKENHVPAWYEMGINYRQGAGVLHNDDEAFFWYEKAAKEGYPPAELMLAQLYESGVGTEVDNEKARVFLQKAVKQGQKEFQMLLPPLGFLLILKTK